MSYIPDRLRQLVRKRADNRCEYCRLSQLGQEATFHIDHIIPQAAEGGTNEGNLALACVGCSLHKAARMEAVDPEAGVATRLFHPREDSWSEHFAWNEVWIQGMTRVGRATVAALRMNRPILIAIRAEERFFGRHPK